MLTPAEFNVLWTQLAIPVEWSPPSTAPVPPIRHIRAIVQAIDKRNEVLVNAYGINGISFMVRAADLVPSKLDTVHINDPSHAGLERYTIHDVVPIHTRGTGVICYYSCYSRGK